MWFLIQCGFWINAVSNWVRLLIFQVLEDAAKLSQRMEHRGACSADNDTGDGAGAMVAIPHDFYVSKIR